MVAKITIIIQKQRMRDQELSFSQRLKQPRFNPGIRDRGQKKAVAGNLDFPPPYLSTTRSTQESVGCSELVAHDAQELLCFLKHVEIDERNLHVGCLLVILHTIDMLFA